MPGGATTRVSINRGVALTTKRMCPESRFLPLIWESVVLDYPIQSASAVARSSELAMPGDATTRVSINRGVALTTKKMWPESRFLPLIWESVVLDYPIQSASVF
ncbi:hypothetical protein ACLB2K_031733 [Fragaria x ananassa]